MKELTFQIGILLGTVIILMVSIAWVDSIAGIMKRIDLFKDPLVGQIVYSLIVTILAIVLLMIFKPFGSSSDKVKVPEGAERAIRDTRTILDNPLEFIHV